MKRTRRMHHIVASGALLVSLFWGVSASAQVAPQQTTSQIDYRQVGEGLFSTMIVVTIVVAIPVSTTLGVSVFALSESQTAAYLEENERNLREVAALGAGDGLGDLGSFLKVPRKHHKALGKHLKKHRKEFLFVLQMKSKQQKGERFLTLVSAFLPAP